MKLIEKLSEYIEEEIEDADKYVDCALKWKEDNPMLAKSFYDLSVQELNHMSILHEEVVKAINDYKQKNGDPPEKMQSVYDYLHERHTKDANNVRLKQMQFKNA